MREDELRKHAKCSKCGQGIGHTGLPLFWTVDVKRHGLDAGALQRQAGLTMFLGGSAALARVMGADEEMTREVMSRELTLCEECAIPIMALLEGCPEAPDPKEKPWPKVQDTPEWNGAVEEEMVPPGEERSEEI